MKPLNSKWLLLFLIVVIGSMTFSLLTLNARRAEFKKIHSDFSQKVADAENSKNYLEKVAAYLKSPAFLEKEARLKFNYKLPDEEVVFVFRDPNPKTETASVSWLSQAPNYKKWWYYVFGY